MDTFSDMSDSKNTISYEDKCRSIGQQLRDAREDLQLSLQRTSSGTRISQPFITLIEKGQFDKLPAPVFARGFIRCLCQFYEIDNQKVLEELDLIYPNSQPSTSSIQKINSPLFKKIYSPSAKKSFPLINTMMIKNLLFPKHYYFFILLLLTTFTSIWFYLPSSWNSLLLTESNEVPKAKKSSNTINNHDSEIGTRDKTIVTDDPNTTKNLLKKQTRSIAQDMKADNTNIGDLTLSLHIKEKVKVKMSMDKGKWKLEELSPDQYHYTFKENAELVISDASFVEIAFNGENLGPLGKSGELRHISFERSYKELKF